MKDITHKINELTLHYKCKLYDFAHDEKFKKGKQCLELIEAYRILGCYDCQGYDPDCHFYEESDNYINK